MVGKILGAIILLFVAFLFFGVLVIKCGLIPTAIVAGIALAFTALVDLGLRLILK